jgi:DNA polymerase-3 subunit epsilon
MSVFARLFGRKPPLTPAQRARLAAWQALRAAHRDTPLDESRLVVVDVESSGLNVRRDRLIAIGAVAVTKGRIRLDDAFERVLQQGAVSERGNILIHGIGATAQREGMAPADALLDFLDYLGASPLVAFHAAFDEAMLRRAMRDVLGVAFRQPFADLAHVVPALCHRPGARHRSLDDWLGFFRIGNYARHSALADAFATAELLLALRPALAARGMDSFSGLQRVEREHRHRLAGA